jgi:hypothetical protein
LLEPTLIDTTIRMTPKINRTTWRGRELSCGTSMLNAFRPPPTTAAITQARPADRIAVPMDSFSDVM